MVHEALSVVPSAVALEPTRPYCNVDERMKTWVHDVLGDVQTSFKPPGETVPPGRSIGLYLIDLTPATSTRGDSRRPLQFCVRYLVTTWSEEASGAHNDLCELAFSALEVPEFEVGIEPLEAVAWAAFGTPPRPSFSVRLVMRRERPRLAAPSVRAPLVVTPSPMALLHGFVLGPGDVAVAGARVELRSLSLVTRCGHEGYFRFAGVPTNQSLRLLIQARGVTQEFQTEGASASDRPLQLRMVLP
jgi:hypothetical protein